MKKNKNSLKYSLIPKSLLSFVLLLSFFLADAQPNMYKTGGTLGTANLLGSTARKSQQLYLPIELTGLQDGNITKVYFRWSATAGVTTYTDFTIKMGLTTNSTFTGTGNLDFYSGLSTVYSAASYVLTTTGYTAGDWVELPMTTPFYYESAKTLIVEISYAALSGTTSVNARYTTGPSAPNHKRLLNSSDNMAVTGTATTNWVDMGFLVGPYATNDAGVVSIDAPPAVIGTGNQNVSVSVRNYGTSTLTQAQINWSVNGIPQAPFNWVGSVAPGAVSAPITIGSYNFSSLGYYTIDASTSLPNAVPDEIPANDAFSKTIKACNALSGAYTIDQTVPATSGTIFKSFADVVEFLTDCGISGPVTFNVINGPYTEHVPIPLVSGVSSTNTITFNGNGQIVTHDGAGTGQRSTILLDGAQYVTLNNFVINATGGTNGWGIHLFNQASNNTISNSTLNISSTSTTQSASAGIAASGSLTSVTTAGSGINNNTIQNNIINGGYQSIVFTGPAQMNNVIINNSITDPYLNGIQITGNELCQISGNNISRPTRTSATALSSGTSGIMLSTGTIKTNVFNNRIHGLYDGMQSSSSGSANGITINTGTTATMGDENSVYNNLIYNFRSNSPINGINQTASPYNKIYHNTIVFDHVASSATGTTRGYVQSTNADGIEFKNNIISITRGGTGIKAAIALVTNGSTIVSDNNVFHVNATNGNIGVWVAANIPDLPTWISTTTLDANSSSADPMFTNAATFNFIPTNPLVNNIGTGVGIATDIDGNTRNAVTPDPGAYEWTPPGLDAAISWVAPALPTTLGLHTITVNIANTKTITINSVELQYTDGTTTVNQTFSGLNLAAGANTNLSFTTQYNLTHPLLFTVNILQVNGTTDDESFNNSVTVYLCAPLSGTYTIDKTIPATDLSVGVRTFKTFNDLASYLSGCGINANVTINVAPGTGPYNEQVVFQNIAGLGASATITIEGNGQTIVSDTAIIQTGSNPNRHIIRLIGLQYFTINNLHIDMFPGSTGFIGIQALNSGNHITISNCMVNMGSATSTLLGAFVFNGDPASIINTGGLFDNILVTGNTTTGGGYGISVFGLASPNLATNVVIDNNTFYDFNTNGVYLRETDGAQVSNNNLDKRAGSTGTTNGIQLAQQLNINGRVFGNRIKMSQTTGSLTCIYLFDGTGHRVYNNVISDIKSTTGTIEGIRIRIANTAPEIYFNTISFDNTNPGSGNLWGLRTETTGTLANIRNNIINITQTTSGFKSAIMLNSNSNVGSTFSVSNYNVFWVPGGYLAGYMNVVTPTLLATSLANWQALSGQDANSLETDPLFQTGTVIPQSSVIANQGIAIPGITTDIVGTIRNNPPDPGAYEFVPPAFDAGITNFILPAIPHCANTLDVQFELTNAGGDPLTSVTIDWTVNGVPQPTVNWAGPTLAPGASTIVTLGTIPVTGANKYDISATSSFPNGVPDVNTSNDSYTYIGFRRGMEGVFTINGSAPASTTNFQSFQSIANELAQWGVCTPVTMNVMNGPYLEQVVFNTIPGTSATNTVTLNGNGQTLQFEPFNANSDHILQINGVNHMIVENLTVNSLHLTQGRGIHITNGSSKIVIRNNTVNVSNTNSISSAFGIIISGANWLLDGSLSDSVIIDNNIVAGGYSAVQLSGEHWTQPLTRVRVTNNQLLDWYGFGVYVSYTNGVIVSNNTIRRPIRSNSGSDAVTPAGITVPAGSLGFLLEKNRIYDLHLNMPQHPSISRGIYMSGTTTAPTSGTIQNNLIYGMNNDGAQYGIQSESATGPVNIYHNTVVLNNATAATTSNTTAMYLARFAVQFDHDIKNNVFVVTRGGSGVKRIFDITTNTVNSASDYNVTYLNASGTQRFGEIGSTFYNTLADWQTTGRDLNSRFTDPLFLNPPAGNFTPTSFLADGANMGTSQVGGIIDDILGNLRSANPDPGAFEFVPTSCTSANGGTASTGFGPFCLSGTAVITSTGYATGTGISYQWEFSNDNFVSNVNDLVGQINPASASTGVITATTYYRLRVTCAAGPVTGYSNIVTVTVLNQATAITQPASIAACPGETRTFTIVMFALPGLSYQWQVSTNGGGTWSDIAGEIFPNLTLTNLTTTMNGNQYRVIVSGCGSPFTSDAATLTVYSPVTITTQPANVSACAGNNATFTVVATGSPTPLAYQWQISTDGGVNYTNIAGANGSSLTLNAVTTTMSTYRYRVIVTGYCGSVTSNAGILTVNIATTPVTVGGLPSRICLSDTLIVLTGTPVGGVWSGVGIIGDNFLPHRTAVGTYTLTYTFTNSFGCASSATLIAKVEDCPERRILLRDDAVIVYPNPNNGQFNIRINSTLYSYLGMKVYDAKGALVHLQNFTGLQYGRVIPIDLRRLSAGVYNVYMYYDGGVRTSEKTFKVVIGSH